MRLPTPLPDGKPRFRLTAGGEADYCCPAESIVLRTVSRSEPVTQSVIPCQKARLVAEAMLSEPSNRAALALTKIKRFSEAYYTDPRIRLA